MVPETLYGLIALAYVAGVILTGMVCAFGAEAFYWDTEGAMMTAFLWPIFLVVVAIFSPFLLAGFLGRCWRNVVDARHAAAVQHPSTEDTRDDP